MTSSCRVTPQQPQLWLTSRFPSICYGFVTNKGHFITQTLFTNWLYIRFFSFDGSAAEPVKVQSRLSNEKRRCCGYNCFIRFSLITARFLAVFYDSSSLTCRLSSWPACSGEEGFSLRGERSIKNKSSSRSEATPRSFFPVAAASSSRLFSHLFSSFLSSVSSFFLDESWRVRLWQLWLKSVSGPRSHDSGADVVVRGFDLTVLMCRRFIPSYIITCFFFSTPPCSHTFHLFFQAFPALLRQ